MDDGLLVSREWLERADAALFGADAPAQVETPAPTSRFYDVRPAILSSAWALGGGEWKATARFIVNGAAAEDTVEIYAPTATATPGGEAGETRLFLVWRGRWEVVGGAAGSPETTTATVVKTATATKTALTVAVGGFTALISAHLETSDAVSEGALPYLAALECVDGEIVATTKYIKLVVTSQTITPTATPSPAQIVDGIQTTNQNNVLIQV